VNHPVSESNVIFSLQDGSQSTLSFLMVSHACQFVQIEKLSDKQCQPVSQLKFVTDAWLQVLYFILVLVILSTRN
jgi:hypothetical protein